MPSLFVDTGNFLADERSFHGELRADVLAQNDWVLKAYDRFRADVINLSAHDLPYLSRMIAHHPDDPGAASSILNRAVAANAETSALGETKPIPFVVRDVPNRAAEGGASQTLRIAFVGLSERADTDTGNFRLTDPLDAARRVVPLAKSQSDVVVVLAHMKTDGAVKLARAVPGIDVLIVGNGELFTPSLRIGRTLIAFTPFETRMLGELRFYPDGSNSVRVEDRYISLDAEIPGDSEALEIVGSWNAAVLEARTAFDRRAGAAALDKAVSPGSTIKTTRAGECASCHLAEYVKWANTRHSRAMDKVIAMQGVGGRDTSCLACHAPADERAGSRPYVSGLKCDQCHGPAGDHIADPRKGYGRVSDMAALCSTCHTPNTSPNFDLKTYWEKIKH